MTRAFRAAALLCVLLMACVAEDPSAKANTVEMTTLETAPRTLRPIEEPQRIEFDQTPAPAGSQESIEGESPTGLAELPFAPKIAMDPVDGSKISIRRDTPIVEFDGRIYYFSSDENRLQFIRSPEQYLSGAFATY